MSADNNNPIKYSDLVKPDNSITDLIRQLDELSDAYQNTLKSVKSEALNVKASLDKLSGATNENRDAIRKGATDADRLARAQRDLAAAESENAKRIAELKQAQREANELNKLQVRLNQSAEGSYNRLSAQYSINKIYLNNMSIAEREGTEDGRKLVQETNAIYEEMKRLQSETGKTSLNVGNYADATKSLTQILRANTMELARMKVAGEEGTAAYQKLLAETGELKDTIADTKNEIKNMASDTSALDAVLTGTAAASGGFGAVTGAMELFGGASEDVEKAQKTLQATIAMTTGLQAIQNAVQKDSALMVGITRIQSAALAKSEAYRRLIQIQGTAATVGATVAQRVFNLVAAANPYVLLAMALITVVGALVLFASGSESAAEKQKKLNEAQKAYLDSLDIEADKLATTGNERVKSLENELEVARARGAKTSEIYKIENDLMTARKENHARMIGFYGTELEQLEANKQKLYQYRLELTKLQTQKAQGTSKVEVDLDLNGKITKAKIDDAIEAIQGRIDNYGRLVEIGTKLKDEGKEIAQQEAVQAAERKKAAIDRAKEIHSLENDLTRKAEDAKISLIANSFAQQRAETTANYSRQISDLQYQLKTDKNMTVKGRQAINDAIKYLEQKKNKDLRDIQIKAAAERLEETRASQDIELGLLAEGTEKRLRQTQVEYDRKIEDIKIRLATEKGLTTQQQQSLTNDIVNIEKQKVIAIKKVNDDAELEQLNKNAETTQLRLESVKEGSDEEINLRIQLINQQRQIELKENAMKTADVRQSETDINKKYDFMVLKQTSDLTQQKAMLLFDQNQALQQSEFDLLETTESKKTKFKLQAEKDRLQKILELNKTAGIKLSDVEVKTIENTIKKIDKEMGNVKPKDIYDMFGIALDDDKKQAINDSTSFALDNLSKILDANVQLADIAVQNTQKEVDASKSRLDAEIEARNNGYANNVIAAQKDLDLKKKQNEKAQKDKEKAVKAQQLLDTVVQTSSLITASANIWASLSAIPIIGVGLAVAALATMWGSFAASKIKAAQVTKAQSESYGDGTVELLTGGSHQSGNDVDLGTKADGTRRRAEGGEYFAVINKRSSRRFRNVIPDVINSLNRGTFADKYLGAYETSGLNFNVTGDTPDIADLKNDVREIRDQNRRRMFTNSRGETVETYKNLRRTYKN